MAFRWRPDLFDALRGYDVARFRGDLIAGVTVGFVALPLALAFGIASGVTPQAGLITAIVGGLVVATLGGSRTQIAGPTGAFVVIVSGIVARNGMTGLLTVTIMAGVMLLVLGITGLGTAVKFIPRPVVIGFTNGIAVLIVLTQIKDFFGLHYVSGATDFLDRTQAIVRHLSGIDPITVSLAVGTLLVAIAIPRFVPRMPGAIGALFAATACAHVFHLHVSTIGSRFGPLTGIGQFAVPHFDPKLYLALLPRPLPSPYSQPLKVCCRQ